MYKDERYNSFKPFYDFYVALSQLLLEEDAGFLKSNLNLAVSLLLLFLLHTHLLC